MSRERLVYDVFIDEDWGGMPTYGHVISKQFLAISHRQWDRVLDFSAICFLAKMSVANSLIAVGVKIYQIACQNEYQN